MAKSEREALGGRPLEMLQRAVEIFDVAARSGGNGGSFRAEGEEG